MGIFSVNEMLYFIQYISLSLDTYEIEIYIVSLDKNLYVK